METVFKTLFTINILHDYYSSGYSEDFSILPTSRSAQIMRNYRILFLSTGSGCQALYEADSEGNPIVEISDDILLDFSMLTSNKKIGSISDIPIDNAAGKIYFLTNIDQTGLQKTHLHSQSDYLGNTDLVKLKPQRFTHSFTTLNSVDSISVEDYSGNSLINEAVESTEGKFVFDVDLTNYDPGLFDLKINSGSDSTFYASNYLKQKLPFGVIEIACSSHQEKNYTINIPVRKTLWRYNVLIKRDTSIKSDDLSIESSSYTFNPSGTKVLSNGLTATLFISSAAIPYSDSPLKGIQLKRSKNNGNGNSSITMFENLESPTPDNLNRSLVNNEPKGDDFYSDIYIYV